MSNGHSHSGQRGKNGLRTASRTHVGLRRTSNQDFLAVRSVGGREMLLVVADGMGGHKGGERASRLATDTFAALVGEGGGREEGKEAKEVRLRNALVAANRAVRDEAARDKELEGMGTTLVAALLHEGEGNLINLGDSRAYLLRGGELRQLTHDHSMVAELVRRGEITEAEAESHPRRNVLTRAVGTESEPKPDLFTLALGEEDILLLCTDGLHGMIDDRSIREILAADWSLEAKCDALIDAALDAGGKDNVTVLLAQRGEGGLPASGPATDPGPIDVMNIDVSGEWEELEEEEIEMEREERKKGEGDGWVYLLIVVLLGLGIWWAVQAGIFSSKPEGVPAPDTVSVDTTGLLLDSNVQLTPSDMVNDSVWSDSLSQPGDSIRR